MQQWKLSSIAENGAVWSSSVYVYPVGNFGGIHVEWPRGNHMEFRWNFLTLLYVDFNTWNPRGARVRCAPLGSRTWTDGRWLKWPFICRQSYVSYQWVISDSSVFHKYYKRLFTYSVRDTYANIFFQWFSVILRCNKRETCVICLLIVSGKSSTNTMAATFSQTITDIPRTFRALSA